MLTVTSKVNGDVNEVKLVGRLDVKAAREAANTAAKSWLCRAMPEAPLYRTMIMNPDESQRYVPSTLDLTFQRLSTPLTVTRHSVTTVMSASDENGSEKAVGSVPDGRLTKLSVPFAAGFAPGRTKFRSYPTIFRKVLNASDATPSAGASYVSKGRSREGNSLKVASS